MNNEQFIKVFDALIDMDEDDLIDITNDYLSSIDKPIIYLNNRDTWVDIFGNSLDDFLDNRDNTDFNEDDNYIAREEDRNWYHTFDYLDDICDLKDVAKYVLDNWDTFSEYFDDDIFDEE